MSADSERIIDLYRRHAPAWGRARGRSLFEKTWLDRFLALLPARGSILDIGCGSGEPIAGCQPFGVGENVHLARVAADFRQAVHCRDIVNVKLGVVPACHRDLGQPVDGAGRSPIDQGDGLACAESLANAASM